MATINELRQKSPAELTARAAELRSTIQGFRFRTATARLKTHREIRSAKRELARVLTVLGASSTTS